jgi:hypothetical protein
VRVAVGRVDIYAALLARVDALEIRNAELAARIAALEAAKPRDRQDAALRRALGESTKGLPFKVSELQAHAKGDPELARAILGADLDSPDGIGAWLRDNVGAQGGVTIERLRGRRWRAYTSSTYVHRPGPV